MASPDSHFANISDITTIIVQKRKNDQNYAESFVNLFVRTSYKDCNCEWETYELYAYDGRISLSKYLASMPFYIDESGMQVYLMPDNSVLEFSEIQGAYARNVEEGEKFYLPEMYDVIINDGIAKRIEK